MIEKVSVKGYWSILSTLYEKTVEVESFAAVQQSSLIMPISKNNNPDKISN